MSWVLCSSSVLKLRGKGLGTRNADKHLEETSVKPKKQGLSWEPEFWSWELCFSKATKSRDEVKTISKCKEAVGCSPVAFPGLRLQQKGCSGPQPP